MPGGGFDQLSVAAMLIPTNDGFFALNGVEGPLGNQTLTLTKRDWQPKQGKSRGSPRALPPSEGPPYKRRRAVKSGGAGPDPSAG